MWGSPPKLIPVLGRMIRRAVRNGAGARRTGSSERSIQENGKGRSQGRLHGEIKSGVRGGVRSGVRGTVKGG